MLVSFVVAGCNTNTIKVAQINDAIDSLKAKFAPDPRVAVFDVKALQSGDAIVVRGEVDNPKAKDALVAALRSENLTDAIDSVVLLPQASLGSKTFGIVDVSVGNMYDAPKYATQMVSQVLLGHTVKVLKEVKGWYYVKSEINYLGWIEPGNIVRIDSAELAAYNAERKLIVTSVYATVYSSPTDRGVSVSDAVMANLLKPLETISSNFKVQMPDGRIGYIPTSDAEYYDQYLATHKPTPEGIEKVAMKLIGVPYLWGGTSAKGVDCSGFCKTVFRMNGIRLPRDASQQVFVGESVDPGPNFVNLKKGDLLFFGKKAEGGKPAKIVHAAIYLGNGYFIQSSGRVRISSLVKGDSAFDQYDLDRFVTARRVLPPSESILEKGNNN
jgi:cell wall-associated NlpC family hydrolase